MGRNVKISRRSHIAAARAAGKAIAAVLPVSALQALVEGACESKLDTVLQAVLPRFNRSPQMDTMPFDLPVGERLDFEQLAGLFASTQFDHGVIAMPVRQAAYVFGLVRAMRPRKVIEVGRYKGGSTLLIAAALEPDTQFWSIDIGEKEARLRHHLATSFRSMDAQTADMLRRFGFRAELVVGDSRTLNIDTGDVDLVFIDGDHTYEGVRIDFERWGRRLRVGGALLFDDAFQDGPFAAHLESVGRLVEEILAEGNFVLAQKVNRLAHLQRVRADPPRTHG